MPKQKPLSIEKFVWKDYFEEYHIPNGLKSFHSRDLKDEYGLWSSTCPCRSGSRWHDVKEYAIKQFREMTPSRIMVPEYSTGRWFTDAAVMQFDNEWLYRLDCFYTELYSLELRAEAFAKQTLSGLDVARAKRSLGEVIAVGDAVDTVLTLRKQSRQSSPTMSPKKKAA